MLSPALLSPAATPASPTAALRSDDAPADGAGGPAFGDVWREVHGARPAAEREPAAPQPDAEGVASGRLAKPTRQAAAAAPAGARPGPAAPLGLVHDGPHQLGTLPPVDAQPPVIDPPVHADGAPTGDANAAADAGLGAPQVPTPPIAGALTDTLAGTWMQPAWTRSLAPADAAAAAGVPTPDGLAPLAAGEGTSPTASAPKAAPADGAAAARAQAPGAATVPAAGTEHEARPVRQAPLLDRDTVIQERVRNHAKASPEDKPITVDGALGADAAALGAGPVAEAPAGAIAAPGGATIPAAQAPGLSAAGTAAPATTSAAEAAGAAAAPRRPPAVAEPVPVEGEKDIPREKALAAAGAQLLAPADGPASPPLGFPVRQVDMAPRRPPATAEPVAPLAPVASNMPTPAAAALLPATPPTADLRLPVAPGQPGFAATFGQQVTLIVRDGVQTARLHLNPAELGPITVQIALEGGKAQVHLAVEHALTRQALEQAMPVLAGSLRESGLTLTGGGVFEQPQPGAGGLAGQAGDGAARDAQARADAGRGDTRRTGERLLDDAGANRPVSMRLRGMVDLVA